MHMTELLATLQDALVDGLVHGLSSFSGWQIVACTLVTTRITIAAGTTFLHCSQAHRSIELHALWSRCAKICVRCGRARARPVNNLCATCRLG